MTDQKDIQARPAPMATPQAPAAPEPTPTAPVPPQATLEEHTSTAQPQGESTAAPDEVTEEPPMPDFIEPAGDDDSATDDGQEVGPETDEPTGPVGLPEDDDDGIPPYENYNLQEENFASVIPHLHPHEGKFPASELSLITESLHNAQSLLMHVIQRYQSTDMKQDDVAWTRTLNEGSILASENATSDQIREVVGRTGARWVQGIKYRNDKGRDAFVMPMVTASKKPTESGKQLTGEDAMDFFLAGTSLGRPITVPLVHSGFWVRLRAPGANFLAEIDRAMAYAKMQLGLDVKGALNTNDRLVFDQILIDAAMRLIIASNYPVPNVMELKEWISFKDKETLIWAMAAAAYPTGVNITVPCNNIECRHVHEFKATTQRMWYMDSSMLSDKQMQLMQRGISKQVTEDELIEYRKEFSRLRKDEFEFEGRTFVMGTPSLSEYIQMGSAWLGALNTAIDRVMEAEPEDDMKRLETMRSMIDVESVCRYGHYIEKIVITNPDNPEIYNEISGRSDILNILRMLSSDPNASEMIVSEVNKFSNLRQVTIVGTKNFPCVKCGQLHAEGEDHTPLIVPFDVSLGFFILSQLRISKAGGTPLVDNDLTMFGISGLEQRVLAYAQQQSLMAQHL